MKEFKIASVGLNDEYVRFLQQLLKLYTQQLNDKWLYIGNFEPQNVISTMGSDFSDAHILLIDMDDEFGRRAWYTLEALFDDYQMVALTNNLNHSGSKWFLQKTTLNWLTDQSTNVISILNTLSVTTE